MLLNKAGKACARCGVVPERRMSHRVCGDCSRSRALEYKRALYAQPEYRVQFIARMRSKYRHKEKNATTKQISQGV